MKRNFASADEAAHFAARWVLVAHRLSARIRSVLVAAERDGKHFAAVSIAPSPPHFEFMESFRNTLHGYREGKSPLEELYPAFHGCCELGAYKPVLVLLKKWPLEDSLLISAIARRLSIDSDHGTDRLLFKLLLPIPSEIRDWSQITDEASERMDVYS